MVCPPIQQWTTLVTISVVPHYSHLSSPQPQPLEHFKESSPSTKRCQTCKRFHHTTLHDSSKQANWPTTALSTSNPNQLTQNVIRHQKTLHFNNKIKVKVLKRSTVKGASKQDMVSRFLVDKNYNNKINSVPLLFLRIRLKNFYQPNYNSSS